MESWSYISRAEDFVHNESIPATDGRNVRNENGQMGWDFKASNSFGTGGFMSLNQESLKNPQIVELGSSAERITESSVKLSSSVMESKYRDTTPLIDLKLGRFPDHNKDVQGNLNPNFPSAESSIPAKRVRSGKLTTQIPYCQVYGCKKDLSNCKEYYKRHKVCEIHSKTAKVIVNSTDQRFCQQCSRFHLLSEFDDGKRSCRKRLAGHNERRRKPCIRMHSGRAGRFFQPYNGTRFNGTSFELSSSVYRDTLPSSLLHVHAQKYEMNDLYRNMSVENETDYRPPRLGISELKDQSSCSNSHMILCNSGSPYPEASNYGCALSLLSCQSQNASNISSSIPTGWGVTQMLPEKLIGMSPQTSTTSRMSNMFPTSGITSADETHMDPILISDGIGSDKYGINEFLPTSGDCSTSTTINLLQLSSQLQQVERQRQYMQVKQEDDTLFGLRIT